MSTAWNFVENDEEEVHEEKSKDFGVEDEPICVDGLVVSKIEGCTIVEEPHCYANWFKIIEWKDII